jgi:hypothetical protein
MRAGLGREPAFIPAAASQHCGSTGAGRKKKKKKGIYKNKRKRERGWKSVESTMIETGIHFPPTSEKWPLSYMFAGRSVSFMETILQLIT